MAPPAPAQPEVAADQYEDEYRYIYVVHRFTRYAASDRLESTLYAYYIGRSVPKNTCHASADLATRLSTMYIFSPNR